MNLKFDAFLIKIFSRFFFFGNKIDKFIIIILEIVKIVLKKKNGFGGVEGC